MSKSILIKAKAATLASLGCQGLILIAVVAMQFFSPAKRYIEPASQSTELYSNLEIASNLEYDNLSAVVRELNLDLIGFNPDNSYTPLPESENIRHVVKQGDTLSNIWRKYSNSTDGSTLAAQAFKKAGLSQNTLKSGEILRIKVSGLGGIQSLRKNLDKTSVIVLNEEGGEFSTNIRERRVRSVERSASGYIVNSFAQSAMDRGIPYEVIDDLVDIFGSRIEFRRDLHPGDTFTIIYSEERLPNGKFIKAGPIRAAAITKSGKREVAIRYDHGSSTPTYYNQHGEPFGDFFLRYPLKFTRISSSFSHSRFHPVLKISRPHNGVDFAAPIGTPIRAVADGVITRASYDRAGGNTVKIKHSSRYSTAYLHLHKIDKNIRIGTKVTRGEQIGTLGMTGLATGPHLHFSFYDNGRYVDPMKITLPTLSNSNATIPASYLKEIIKQLDDSTEGLRIAQKGTSQGQSVG